MPNTDSKTNTVGWDDINWRKVERYVFKLQTRIYADIAKCFDRINHLALLQKLGYTGKIRQQIKAWLKSGVIDQRVFTATSEGTMQGGVISPLLANPSSTSYQGA
jgi:hypothetical protein